MGTWGDPARGSVGELLPLEGSNPPPVIPQPPLVKLSKAHVEAPRAQRDFKTRKPLPFASAATRG